jgi:hypothetical protein
MKRTTVFLPDDLHERLRKESRRSRTSNAELIRSRLERTYRPSKHSRAGIDPLADVEGIVHDGKLSIRIDQTLYGDWIGAAIGLAALAGRHSSRSYRERSLRQSPSRFPHFAVTHKVGGWLTRDDL